MLLRAGIDNHEWFFRGNSVRLFEEVAEGMGVTFDYVFLIENPIGMHDLFVKWKIGEWVEKYPQYVKPKDSNDGGEDQQLQDVGSGGPGDDVPDPGGTV
jgi:hypothetical protein